MQEMIHFTTFIHKLHVFTVVVFSHLLSFHFMFHISFFFLFKYMHTLKCPHYSIKSCTWATYKNIYTHFFLVNMPFLLVAHKFYKVAFDSKWCWALICYSVYWLDVFVFEWFPTWNWWDKGKCGPHSSKNISFLQIRWKLSRDWV